MPLRRRPSAFSLSTITHAAWAISLGNIYQHEDTLFSAVMSGRRFPRDRPLPRAESIMGLLPATLYLRIRLRADEEIEDLLRGTQDKIVSMIPYQREGFTARSEILHPQAIYLSSLNWHSIGNDILARVIDFENPDGSITRLEGRRDLHTPFIIDVWEHHDHLRIIAKWDEKLYDLGRVALMLDQLTDNLSRIAASTAKRVGDLWTMRDVSGKEPANGHKLDNSETSIAALGTPIERPSDDSPSPKAATPVLDTPHSNSTFDVLRSDVKIPAAEQD